MCFMTAGGSKISRRKPSWEANLVTMLGTQIVFHSTAANWQLP